MKSAISVIESSSLQVEKESCERFHSDQPCQCEASVGIMSAVVELWYLWVVPVLVAVLKVSSSFRVQGADRLKKGEYEILLMMKAS